MKNQHDDQTRLAPAAETTEMQKLVTPMSPAPSPPPTLEFQKLPTTDPGEVLRRILVGLYGEEKGSQLFAEAQNPPAPPTEEQARLTELRAHQRAWSAELVAQRARDHEALEPERQAVERTRLVWEKLLPGFNAAADAYDSAREALASKKRRQEDAEADLRGRLAWVDFELDPTRRHVNAMFGAANADRKKVVPVFGQGEVPIAPPPPEGPPPPGVSSWISPKKGSW